MAYSDKVLDHFENPRNVGKLDKDSPNVGTGLVGAPACGDVLKLMIEVDDNDKIIDAKFTTYFDSPKSAFMRFVILSPQNW